MFANRIRNSALALAGAAIVTTALMAPAASAAGVPGSATGATETQAVDPSKMPKVPLADLQVTPLGITTNPAGTVYYKFRIKNYGPSDAPVNFKGTVRYRYTDSGSPENIHSDGHFDILKRGEAPAEYVYLDCPFVDLANPCAEATLYAAPVGVDPNPENNQATIEGPGEP